LAAEQRHRPQLAKQGYLVRTLLLSGHGTPPAITRTAIWLNHHSVLPIKPMASIEEPI
jgi:hypothetical protein